MDPFAITALALCVYAAATDVKRLEIDNWVPCAIIALFVAFAITNPVVWPVHVIVMLVIFAIGFALNAAGILGGGDVKLLSALSLWAGIGGLPYLMMGTAVCGAAVAIATLSLRQMKLEAPTGLAWVDGASAGRNHVAYGIAIAAGAAFMFANFGG